MNIRILMKTNGRSLGCLVAAILLSSYEPQARGQNAANAFDMGLYLGFASYQASWKQTSPAYSAIRDAQTAADRLAESNLLPKTTIASKLKASSLHNDLVKVRGEYEIKIRQRSNNAANAYRLGLLLGLAEAQCTSPKWNDSKTHALIALKEADTLIKNSSLSKLNFNHKMLEDTFKSASNQAWPPRLSLREEAYENAVALRKAYRDVVLVSSY
jgi:hypothetical protein